MPKSKVSDSKKTAPKRGQKQQIPFPRKFSVVAHPEKNPDQILFLYDLLCDHFGFEGTEAAAFLKGAGTGVKFVLYENYFELADTKHRLAEEAAKNKKIPLKITLETSNE
ncbi:MAG: hypothetical protein GX221_06990 [Candidatus Riflebacteria bacterium]|nr:hypothetical protein [Candidatus Riflebacteria bacterium]